MIKEEDDKNTFENDERDLDNGIIDFEEFRKRFNALSQSFKNNNQCYYSVLHYKYCYCKKRSKHNKETKYYDKIADSPKESITYRGVTHCYYHFIDNENRDCNFLSHIDANQISQLDGVERHIDFNHLNSSQSLAFNFFLTLYNSKPEFQNKLIQRIIHLLSGDKSNHINKELFKLDDEEKYVVDFTDGDTKKLSPKWFLEVCSYKEDKNKEHIIDPNDCDKSIYQNDRSTNIDMVIPIKNITNNEKIYLAFECKYSEPNVGTKKKDPVKKKFSDAFTRKCNEFYFKCFPEFLFGNIYSIDDFVKYYQFYRMIRLSRSDLEIDKGKNILPIFITPKETMNPSINNNLNDSYNAFEKQIQKKEQIKFSFSHIFWEDVIESIPEFDEFREKYFTHS